MLPVARADEERIRRRMAKLAAPDSEVPGPFGHGLPRHRYRDIEMHVTAEMLVAFELGQYAPARPGDVVIDGGAGFGETALVYAQQVGPEGRVVAVELDGGNLAMIERNLALNPALAERIEVVQGALWSHAGADLEYGAMAGQSSVLGGGARARSITVDGLSDSIAWTSSSSMSRPRRPRRCAARPQRWRATGRDWRSPPITARTTSRYCPRSSTASSRPTRCASGTTRPGRPRPSSARRWTP